jgi:hypothetical protein
MDQVSRSRCKTDPKSQRLSSRSSYSNPKNGRAWMAFISVNCAALFQTALLLAADVEIAESAILAAVVKVDISRLPGSDELFFLQRTVATETLKRIRSNLEPASENASPFVQTGLRRVLRLEQSARICFVLRILLGYSSSSCAKTLGLQEETVSALLSVATGELHHPS